MKIQCGILVFFMSPVALAAIPRQASLPPFESPKTEIKDEFDATLPAEKKLKEQTDEKNPSTPESPARPVPEKHGNSPAAIKSSPQKGPEPSASTQKVQQQAESQGENDAEISKPGDLRQMYFKSDWSGLRKAISEIKRTQSLSLEQRYIEAVVTERLDGALKSADLYDRLFQDGYSTTSFYKRYLRVLYQVGQFPRAQKVGWTLLQREPQLAGLHYTVGLVESQLEHYNSALKLLEQARNREPRRKEIHQALAFVGDKLQRTDVRLRALKELMWIEPENPNFAQSYLTTLLHDGTRGPKAQVFFAEAQKIRSSFPQSPGINRLMAKACRGIGRDDLARFYDKEATRWAR